MLFNRYYLRLGNKAYFKYGLKLDAVLSFHVDLRCLLFAYCDTLKIF